MNKFKGHERSFLLFVYGDEIHECMKSALISFPSQDSFQAITILKIKRYNERDADIECCFMDLKLNPLSPLFPCFFISPLSRYRSQ